ncbi:MAG: hypothetical protein CL763_03585 [Chloroflexi bacterium]|nr:hypothetical protein [Chloroflexota bacterium]|tara:strand:- start:4596 stop:5315 length:720 start_codon:yes stop_codon:yes gene_type:complete
MSTFSSIEFVKADGIGFVTLNRPEKINAFNIQMRDDFSEILMAINQDDDIRGVIFSGAGEDGFCSGADLTEFGTAPSMTVARYARISRDVWGGLSMLQKPTLVAIHGHCIGTGVELSALCDFRYATQDAVFRMPELHLGLIPAAGGTQSLPSLLQMPRALELLLTGRSFNAVEAFEIGLVDGLFADRESMMLEIEEKMRNVIANDANIIRYIKQSVTFGAELPLSYALRVEQILASRLK